MQCQCSIRCSESVDCCAESSMRCARLPSCTGCAVFPPPDAESQLCRRTGEQTAVWAAIEKTFSNLEESVSVSVREFCMISCDLDLSIDSSAAVLFNDAPSAWSQVLTEL